MQSWAQIVLIACAVVLTAALVAASLALRRALIRADAVLAILEQELRPLIGQAHGLTEDVRELARKAQELATDAQGRAGEWLDKSRELFEEQTQRLMTAFEAGKDAMREEMRKGPTPPRG